MIEKYMYIFFIIVKFYINGLYLYLLLIIIYFNFFLMDFLKDLYLFVEFVNYVRVINEKGKVRVWSVIMIYIYRDLCKFFVKKYDYFFYEREREGGGGLSINYLFFYF